MGRALKIRDDLGAHELPGWARKAGNGRASARAYAIANALDGLRRAEAARLPGMKRQALRDAVVRYNAEGLAGFFDRPKGRPARRLPHDQRTKSAYIFGAICPDRGVGAALVLPRCNTQAMQWHLDDVSSQVKGELDIRSPR